MGAAEQGDLERIDQMLDEVQIKHFEMAGLIGEYRTMVHRAMLNSDDQEAIRMIRHLPGAKYHVASTYVVEQWKVIAAEATRTLDGGGE
jgi:hypothetical protein